MTITSELNGTERYVVIDGRLDTNSSPQLEAALDELTDGGYDTYKSETGRDR